MTGPQWLHSCGVKGVPHVPTETPKKGRPALDIGLRAASQHSTAMCSRPSSSQCSERGGTELRYIEGLPLPFGAKQFAGAKKLEATADATLVSPATSWSAVRGPLPMAMALPIWLVRRSAAPNYFTAVSDGTPDTHSVLAATATSARSVRSGWGWASLNPPQPMLGQACICVDAGACFLHLHCSKSVSRTTYRCNKAPSIACVSPGGTTSHQQNNAAALSLHSCPSSRQVP